MSCVCAMYIRYKQLDGTSELYYVLLLNGILFISDT